ncbi:hypothetical protein BUE93_20375 [Chromobacterium amazonense]|uniref:Bacterial type II secretion system protein E domain-containing protein n=1 Tax=Chromobacterium amazonense TaxID=1382803 RepID=A0A2S9WZA8_9NEIS|nr:ATPase, T2SS/T4P/T4SS family [Chromobacterium amazonense]PRP68805.1 hypothetical protein BUE93_20375 [Chromobacterium amazonense]
MTTLRLRLPGDAPLPPAATPTASAGAVSPRPVAAMAEPLAEAPPRDLRTLFAGIGLSSMQIQQVELRMQRGEDMTDVIRDLGYASDDAVAGVQAQRHGYGLLTADAAREVDLQAYLQAGFSMDRSRAFVPVAWEGDTLTVAVSRYQQTNDAMSYFSEQLAQAGRSPRMQFVFASDVTIQSLHHRWFSHSETALRGRIDECDKLYGQRMDDAMQERAAFSIRQLVFDLLRHAAYAGASDIHLERTRLAGYILLRHDGVRRRFAPMRLETFEALCNVLRNMTQVQQEQMKESLMVEGGLHEETQRALEQNKDDEIAAVLQRWNFRFQFGQAISGETVTIRLNDGQGGVADWQKLGFKPDHQAFLESVLHSSDGLVIITGPTGSGKTTTLYAALQRLDGDARSIQSIERPVEFQDPRWRQYQIPTHVPEVEGGKKLLKGQLRNDPDVILMGEVRDREAVELLLRASTTGHLVLSTFHIKTAPTTFTQFREYGIRGEAVASELKAIIAQRLVRRLCPSCCEPDDRPASRQTLIDHKIEAPNGGALQRASRQGCPACHHTGYRGRRMVYELLRMTPAVRQLIEEDAPISRIAAAAFQGSYRRMWHHALELVAEGVTSLDEIHANVPEEV